MRLLAFKGMSFARYCVGCPQITQSCHPDDYTMLTALISLPYDGADQADKQPLSTTDLRNLRQPSSAYTLKDEYTTPGLTNLRNLRENYAVPISKRFRTIIGLSSKNIAC